MAARLRRLSGLTAVAAFVLLLAPIPSFAAEPDVITVPVPGGVLLPPGSYQVEVRGNGQGFSTEVTLAPPPSGASGPATQVNPPAPAAEPPGGDGQVVNDRQAVSDGVSPIWLILALVLAVLGVAGTLLYLKVFVPRRQVRPYREAVRLLAAERYHEAVPALSRVEGTLPARLRADARFFIAFALYKLDKLDEAEHLLAALNRESPRNPEVAYLLAYLRTERRDYDGAEPVLEVLESGKRFDGRTRLLYGIIKFHRGLEALRDGRIDAAAELFEKVEQLGDFADRIPVDLRNRHIVMGTQALFDKDVIGARKQFEHLEQSAGRLDPGQREPMLAFAKLGLALAAWVEGSPAKVEGLLVEAIRLLDPTELIERDWPDEDDGFAGLAERLEVLAGKKTRSEEEAERERLLRDIHFLRGAAVLGTWAAVEPSTAVEQEPAYLTRALRRFAGARAHDGEFSDVYLVVGLLRYYLATEDGQRADSLHLLRRAQALGTRDPEVLQILNYHARRDAARRDAVDAYLHVLDRYLNDPTVREQVRTALLQRMSRYRKVSNWDTRRELVRVRSVPPTVAELNDRSALLLERVRQLTETDRDAHDFAQARELTRILVDQSRALSEQARSVEENEAELLAHVGDRLLAD